MTVVSMVGGSRLEGLDSQQLRGIVSQNSDIPRSETVPFLGVNERQVLVLDRFSPLRSRDWTIEYDDPRWYA